MVGIICEYNPFHNGHIYHLQTVKKMFPDKVITLILAGHFLNRGDVSVMNKWDKTAIALTYGVDLVIELPFCFASQAADIYAYGAIQLLNHLHCEAVVFGSECNDIGKLKEMAHLSVDRKKYQHYMKEGYHHPASIAKASSLTISSPNDLLAISYIKAIYATNSAIQPICIQRTNDYHNFQLTGKISSASSIRKAWLENKDISSYVPQTKNLYCISLEDFFPYLKHQIIIDSLTQYQGIDEKLANRLKKIVSSCSSVEELIYKAKTKNYTYNYIKRGLVHMLTGFTKEMFSKEITYLRVLGFSKKGQTYLHNIKKEVTLPIITSYQKELSIELQASKIYALVVGDAIYEQEIRQKPIMK